MSGWWGGGGERMGGWEGRRVDAGRVDWAQGQYARRGHSGTRAEANPPRVNPLGTLYSRLSAGRGSSVQTGVMLSAISSDTQRSSSTELPCLLL